MSRRRPVRSRRLTALAAVALAAPLALSTSPGHAVTGPVAADTSYAFTARLVIGEGESMRACSGALIDSRWIMTAASCFGNGAAEVAPGKPPLKTVATVGRTDLASATGHVSEIVEIVPRVGRDLLLARLAAPATGVTPVPVSATPAAVGDTVTTAGFGRTKTEWAPLKLHTATFGVDAVSDTSIDISGKTPDDSICMGDAGGPLLRMLNGRLELVGVNSRSTQGGCFGTDAAETRTNAIDTRVDGLGAWTALVTGARWGQAGENADASQELSGDFDGDGKTDTAVLHKYAPAASGANHTALWKFTSTASGTYNPVRAWDNLASSPTSWNWDASKSVAGDFNGDGRTDVAVLYDNGRQTDGSYRSTLWTFTSNGTGFNAPALKWSSGTGSWNWDRSKPVAGDFNGDGRTDVAVLYNNGQQADGGYGTTLWTFTANATGFDAPTVKWSSGAMSWTWDRSKPVTGDFNGDGRTDLAVLYNNGQQTDGGYRTTLWTFTANATGFDAPTVKWNSGTGSWNWDRSKPVTGDFNGDGRTDLAVLYNNGQQTDGSYRSTLWTFTANATGFDAPAVKWTAGTISWNWDRSKPLTGDFNGDGTTDVTVLYNNGQQTDGSYRTALWRFAGTGAAFANPVRVWDSIDIAD
ncbi:FG-GAP-like repeat-containing protein [Streptomyces sp. NPDC101145]|uniref:FG-GAP-like repeat-containing protein n=1 Tax=Streptomyces sp. NPDC101145 TaxID=3366112 RepID=UPI00380BE15E